MPFSAIYLPSARTYHESLSSTWFVNSTKIKGIKKAVKYFNALIILLFVNFFIGIGGGREIRTVGPTSRFLCNPLRGLAEGGRFELPLQVAPD